MAEAQRELGPLKAAVPVARRSGYRLATRKMPRIMAVDVVRSFTCRSIFVEPVSLVCLISRISTGGCRVVALKTNAAGLSLVGQNALPAQSTVNYRICSRRLQ
jgi:hypothetical protein